MSDIENCTCLRFFVVLALGPPVRATWFTAMFAVVGIVAVISWPLAVYYMFKTVANRKPGLRLFHDVPTFGMPQPWWLRNPFNHILVTENLTDAGIQCRRRLVYSVVCFVVPIVVVILIGAITGQLD